MASVIAIHPGDVMIHLRSDEHSALLSLLYELQDKESIEKLIECQHVALTPQEINKIATLWHQLAINAKR